MDRLVSDLLARADLVKWVGIFLGTAVLGWIWKKLFRNS